MTATTKAVVAALRRFVASGPIDLGREFVRVLFCFQSTEKNQKKLT